MAEPLKGGISFSEVMQQPNFPVNDPGLKAQVALEFFNDRVKPQLDAKGVKDPGMVEQARQEFFNDYKIQDIPQATGMDTTGRSAAPVKIAESKNVLQDISKGLNTINLAAGSFFDPAIGAYTFGITDPKEQAEADARKQYPGIETDPGLLGHAYRLHQNGLINSIGGMAGAFGGTAGIVKGAEQGIAQGLTKYGGGFAKPFLGTAQKAANTLGVAGYSGLSNLASTFKGDQNPLEAIGNTAMDIATAPLGGKTRLRNALVQGGVGGLQSGLSNLLHGQAINWQEALKNTLLQAGMGAALHEHAPVSQPKKRRVQTRPIKSPEAIGTRSKGTITTNRQAKEKLIRDIVEYRKAGKTNEARVLMGQVTQYMPEKAAAQFKDEVDARHRAETAQTKQKTAVSTKEERFEKLVDFVQQLRKAGRDREANIAMGQYTPETRAKVFDEVKRRETAAKEARKEADRTAKERAQEAKARVKQGQDVQKTIQERKAAENKAQLQAEIKRQREITAEEKAGQKRQRELEAEGRKLQGLKERQAVKDQLALERAESKARQRELKQLRGSIQERAKTVAADDKAAQQLMSAVKTATKGPVERTGTAVDYRAPGPDEYSKMAKDAKDAQKAQSKQQKGQQSTQGPKGDQQQQTPAKPDQKREKVAPGPRVASRQAIKAEAEVAKQSGELVEFNYSAEGGRSRVNEERIVQQGTARDGRTEARQIGGESLDKRQGYRKEVVIETGVTKAGDDYMRTMDGDGNIATRIISGRGQKSKVNWLRRTGEQPPEGFGGGAGSRGNEFAYSSKIKGDVSNMKSVLDRLSRGEAVTNKEIIEAAKPISEKDFIDATKDLPGDKLDETGRKVDC